MILAKSVSRFARNTVDTLNFTRELRGLGIPVIFEEQKINSIYPESEFLITLHGAFAQAESESTSSRVRWGKRQAMKSGHAAMHYERLLGYEKGPDGRPVSAAAYRKEFAALMARIGAEGATPHWCRHTCATRLHQAGADPLAIKRILGHADQSVTEHYTHLDAAFLRAELEKMP